MATMKELNSWIRTARASLEAAQKQADALTIDPGDVASEIGLLKATVKGQVRKLDFYNQLVDRLKASRKAVREVLGAANWERTADAAKRVVEEKFGPWEYTVRKLLRAEASENTADAARRVIGERDEARGAVSRITLRDKTALATLRSARLEVRKILGAKKGETTRAAAARVMNGDNTRPKFKFDTYNDLDTLAMNAGWPKHSVYVFVRDLQTRVAELEAKQAKSTMQKKGK